MALKINKTILLLGLSVILLLFIQAPSTSVHCAPTSSSNNNGNRFMRSGLLSNLFRRQTNSNKNNNSDSSSAASTSSESSTTASSNDQGESMDEPPSQTEVEAQKFMDSLPIIGGSNSNSNNNEPTTFRERVSDTFGLLRTGVNNHFRSMRENFSETVEDLRDTWSNNSNNND